MERSGQAEVCKTEGHSIQDRDLSILEKAFELREQQQTQANKDAELGILNFVVDTWKTQIYKQWLPLINHKCIVNISNMSNSMDSLNSIGTCVLENVIFTMYKTRAGDMHPCIKDFCTEQKGTMEYELMHAEKQKTYTELYICTYSGKAHFCGNYCGICKPEDNPDCEEAKLYENELYNRDGTLVCPLSGMCFEAQKYAPKFDITPMNKYDFEQGKRDYKQFKDTFGDENSREFYNAMKQIKSNSKEDDEFGSGNKRQFKLISNFRARKRTTQDTYDTVAPEDITEIVKKVLQSKNKNHIDLRNFKRHSSQTMKHFYLTLAAVRIADMLSPVRLDQYEENNEKKTSKFIKAMTSYVNKCYTKHEPLNICKLTAVVRDESRTVYVPPRIMLPVGHITHHVIDYAKMCVCAWYAIITNTTQGRKEPGSFKFTEFIDAFISMIKKGFTIDLPSGEIVVIYDRDNFLTLIPNIDEEERKKGDYTSRHWRKHVSTVKRKIQNSISDTIIKENIHYNKLSPRNYVFEELEDRHFIEIKEWQKTKVQAKKTKPKQTPKNLERELEQQLEELLDQPKKKLRKE